MEAENVELAHHPLVGQEPKWFFYRYEWAGGRRTTQEFAARDPEVHRALVLQRIEGLEGEARRLRSVLAHAPAEVTS